MNFQNPDIGALNLGFSFSWDPIHLHLDTVCTLIHVGDWRINTNQYYIHKKHTTNHNIPAKDYNAHIIWG